MWHEKMGYKEAVLLLRPLLRDVLHKRPEFESEIWKWQPELQLSREHIRSVFPG